ncbi:CaiB/BaiF CoA transferase family protein [Amycolatopsis jejuensis]|uniref:CaiB/BaiF CoA transferase family protein n=1 Tax=Amycolatopsis jejuensis TaxID=330084 RepID=UPI0005240A4B|nr:CaiB/BaiF CoA-transferase family protein [Amycolatopsis jejuensis]
MSGTGTGLLDGVRVLEVGQLVAGPYAACLLAEMGADVVKIEPPRRGDTSRLLLSGGRPYLWWIENRNKRCVTLDLTTDAGRELFLGLVERADVLVENNRPGTLERWGLGEDVLRAANEGLVLVRISGFGQNGPYRDRPATDRQALAMAGISYLTGHPDAPPVRPGVPVADYVAGVHGALSALAGVFARRVNAAPGETVDISLLDGMLRMTQGLVQEYLDTGTPRERTGNRNPSVPGEAFRSADGVWLMISVGTDRNWQHLAAAVNRRDWADDPGLAHNEGRRQREEELVDGVAAWVRERDAAEIEKVLAEHGVPCGRFFTAADLLGDPHLEHRGAHVTIETGDGATVAMPAPVGRFSQAHHPVRHAGPQLGAHNREIYGGLLGVPEARLDELREAGVI